ncbi:hypothetical protein [Sutcliffiella rhizosphaerae]|uniref:Uncharacterized protein n=1 Tax=Sutcliffiella rhizosphaerae TaxID=2880967 RepID=A0ABM8YR20_9BACI|nr:hypothetical protein [Sutcliffiella rhizosphaerae]CAG9622382.1 hypothetical protein BACCIP111883_03173 [Sutcliffiella rhizosphaerae]
MKMGLNKLNGSVIIGIILLFNYIIYRLEAIPPLPKEIIWGSLIDLMVIVPILIFYLSNKKFSAFPFIVLVGLSALYLIIPAEMLVNYAFTSLLGFAGRISFASLVLLILYQLIKKIIAINHSLKNHQISISFLQERLDIALKENGMGSSIFTILATHVSMIYYAFFSWKNKSCSNDQISTYSFHKKSSYIAIQIMLIHAIILETAGIHFFLHTLNEKVAYIVLVVNIYTVIYFGRNTGYSFISF